MPITCVTAFYAIGREGVDGRSVSDYKQWLLKTLSTIRDPFIVYLDSSLGWKDELIAARSNVGPVDICETAIVDIPMWTHRDTIAAILSDPAFKSKQRHPRDITNVLPEYCVVQYSKFGWLDDAIRRNPFETSHFAWLDAGSSRFYEPTRVYSSRPVSDDMFFVEVNSRRSWLGTLVPDEYIGTCECVLHGTMLVMTPRAFKVVRDEVMCIFMDEMLAKGRVDNEQIALALAYPAVKDCVTLVDAERGRVFFQTFFS
jgi:hypothetical protein